MTNIYTNRDEDWSDDFDDRDSDDWEEYYSLPERDDAEFEHDMLGHEEEQYTSEEIEQSDEGVRPRLLGIVQWLENSDLVKPLHGSRGFLIHKGQVVRFQDGRISELIDWILEEGVVNNERIGNYQIVHIKHCFEIEQLIFVNVSTIADIPFTQTREDDDSVPFYKTEDNYCKKLYDNEDDIPF